MSVNITKNSDVHHSEELSFTDFKVKILTKNMITVWMISFAWELCVWNQVLESLYLRQSINIIDKLLALAKDLSQLLIISIFFLITFNFQFHSNYSVSLC